MTENSAPGRGEVSVPAASGSGRGRVAIAVLIALLAALAVAVGLRQGVRVDPRWVLWGGAALAVIGLVTLFALLAGLLRLGRGTGEHAFLNAVTDTIGQTSEPDTTGITVADLTAPTADAGPDQDVVAGDEVTFAGSGSSDNSGTIANWTWTFEEDGDTLVLYGVSPARVFSEEGTYPVTLTVKDAAGNSDTDEVAIRVASANEPPVADAGEDAEIETGDPHTFDGTGSSDDGGLADLNFTWTFEYDGEEVKLYGAEPEFTFDIAGEYSVNLTVRDEEGLTDWDTVVVTVEEAGVSMMLWAAIGAVVVVAVLLAAYMVMRRGKGPVPSGGEEAEELEEPGPPDDEEL